MRHECLTLCVVIGLSGLARAETFVVNPEGTGDYATIQAAVNAVPDGSVIELADGTFTGDGNRDVTCSARTLTIRSQSGNRDACTIDCEGGLWQPHRAFLFDGCPAVALSGFTIAGGHIGESSPGGATYSGGSGLTMHDLVFLGNRCEWSGGAVACQYVGTVRFTQCRFVGNSSGLHGGAIWSGASAAMELEDCVFLYNSTALTGGAIEASGSSSLALERCTFGSNASGSYGGAIGVILFATLDAQACTFAGNQASYGAHVHIASGASGSFSNVIAVLGLQGTTVNVEGSATFTCCDFFVNEGGDWVAPYAGRLGVDGNIAADPQFCSLVPNIDQDWELQSDSPCVEPQSGCGTIGAWDVRCGTAVSETDSWGAIKAKFRD